MQKYIDMLLAEGAADAKEIDVSTVVTAAWTFHKCKFGCKAYGKSHCCPPNTPKWNETQEILNCYKRGILFRFTGLENDPVTVMAAKVAREMFLDGYYKVIPFGSGPCSKCKVCNMETCHFPHDTCPAMEACGIDVFATARNNGFPIVTIRDISEDHNYYGLLLAE
ncbi:MAG: DUF2284 domain-containing protein [Clostridia bacterium]|nr:DUF2284 domain-containing protein [Clostridia bacterium]